jgi:hypothetical protein
VAHACNPSYSEGRDQEDRGLKPALENSSRDPIFKKKHIIRKGGVAERVAQGVGPEFKTQYCKQNKTITTRPYKRIINSKTRLQNQNQVWKYRNARGTTRMWKDG